MANRVVVGNPFLHVHWTLNMKPWSSFVTPRILKPCVNVFTIEILQ